MITLQLRAYNKNKCNLISRSDGGADLLTWCLNIRVDYSFFNSMSDSLFYCNAYLYYHKSGTVFLVHRK